MLSECKVRAMLATTLPQAARAFYEDVLGLKLIHEHDFALMFQTAGEGLLQLQKVQAFTPHPFTSLGWNVPDIHAAVAELRAKGVAFERFEGMEQDADGVWIPPGGAAGVCWFKDPDGNLLSLTGA